MPVVEISTIIAGTTKAIAYIDNHLEKSKDVDQDVYNLRQTLTRNLAIIHGFYNVEIRAGLNVAFGDLSQIVNDIQTTLQDYEDDNKLRRVKNAGSREKSIKDLDEGFGRCIQSLILATLLELCSSLQRRDESGPLTHANASNDGGDIPRLETLSQLAENELKKWKDQWHDIQIESVESDQKSQDSKEEQS